jgi:hypothetical protein
LKRNNLRDISDDSKNIPEEHNLNNLEEKKEPSNTPY